MSAPKADAGSIDRFVRLLEQKQKAELEHQRKAIEAPLGYFGTVTNNAVMPQSDVLMLGANANYVRAKNVGTA